MDRSEIREDAARALATKADLHAASLRAIQVIHARAAHMDKLASEFSKTDGKMFAMLTYAASQLREITRAVDMAIIDRPPSAPVAVHSPSAADEG